MKLVRLPIKFIWGGIREISKLSVSSILFFSILFLFVFLPTLASTLSSTSASTLINILKVVRGVNLSIILIPLLVIMFPFIFSKPSTYAGSGGSPESTKFVVAHLKSRNFKTVKEIELLKKSVKPFEDQTRSRVTVLQWIVGLIWGGFIYSLSTSDSWLVYTLMGLGIISYFLVWGYEAALDRLFRTIEFGCNDFCQHLETPKARWGNSQERNF